APLMRSVGRYEPDLTNLLVRPETSAPRCSLRGELDCAELCGRSILASFMKRRANYRPGANAGYHLKAFQAHSLANKIRHSAGVTLCLRQVCPATSSLLRRFRATGFQQASQAHGLGLRGAFGAGSHTRQDS